MDLPTYHIPVGKLLQHVGIAKYRDQPLHFGRSGENRYDAPNRDYGVLYVGSTLATALMESVFHEHDWDRNPNRSIGMAAIQRRIVRIIGVRQELRLCNLTAPRVMAAKLGLNLAQMIDRDYLLTQAISDMVHCQRLATGEPKFDGIRYFSRNNCPSRAIAIFEHAKDKIEWLEDIDLAAHRNWPTFLDDFKISVEPDADPLNLLAP